MDVLVIIPAYNEEKNIDKVIRNIDAYTIIIAKTHPEIKLDYIVINDCSKDETLNKCRESGYNYLDLSVNLGIGGGVQAGYLYAVERGYDIAIQHDGDGQHDPAFFMDVIAPIETGRADIVIGSRFLNNKGFRSTGIRRFGISFLSKLIYLCSGVKIYDVTSGYRAVNRKYIKFFAARYAQDYPEPQAIVEAKLNNAAIMEVPVVMHERTEGKSSINLYQSFYYMIKVSLAIVLHSLFSRKKG